MSNVRKIVDAYELAYRRSSHALDESRSLPQEERTAAAIRCMNDQREAAKNAESQLQLSLGLSDDDWAALNSFFEDKYYS